MDITAHDTRGTLETLTVPGTSVTDAEMSCTITLPDLSDATTRPWGLNPPLASGTPKPKRNAAKAQARRRMQKESRRRNRR